MDLAKSAVKDICQLMAFALSSKVSPPVQIMAASVQDITTIIAATMLNFPIVSTGRRKMISIVIFVQMAFSHKTECA